MSKYIDAELIEFVTGGLDESSELDYVRRYVIDRIPTADVQEVKHGRWFEHQEGRWIYAKCSVCNTVRNTPTNYCPNCGSRMDLDGDTE